MFSPVQLLRQLVKPLVYLLLKPPLALLLLYLLPLQWQLDMACLWHQTHCKQRCQN
jgi:hypothetical protein